MMKFYFFPLFLCFLSFQISVGQKKIQTITGRVSHLGEVVQGAKVSVLETDRVAYTDKSGKYSIEAQPKETLRYEYAGLRTFEIIVEDVTKILNVSMRSEVTELDEVVVAEQRLSRQDSLEIIYKYGKGVVKSAYGFIDKRTTWHSFKVVEEEELLHSFDILDVIRKINPSARPTFDPVTGLMTGICIGRRFGSLLGCKPVGFDVDGSLLSTFPFIPIFQIKRIAVIQGSTAFATYGRFAEGGIIIINTKTGEYQEPGGKDGESYDYAKLRNNIFNGDAIPHSELNRSNSEYLALLAETNTKEKAMGFYKERSGLFGDSPDFHFDTAAYFKNTLNDNSSYFTVLGEIQEKFASNANVLKVLAYHYEETGDLDVANDMYIKILKLRPSYGQSYRDLANSFKKTGDEKMALELVSRYKKAITDFNIIEDISVQSEIDSIISVEAKSLVKTGKVRLKNKLKKRLNNEIWPIRLLVEWNNSDAEFDIQLVNPDNHYYTWSHTLEKNEEFLRDEKIRGFSSKQFYIASKPSGQWQFNVKYYGNKTFDDTYLKVTVYHNYGSNEERERSHIFKLSSKNVNQSLLTIPTPVSP